MLDLTMELCLDALRDDAALERAAEAGIRYLSVPYAFFDEPEAWIRARTARFASLGMRVDTCHLPFGGGRGAHSTCCEDAEELSRTAAMWKRYLARFPLAGVRATPLHTCGCMRADIPQRLRDNLTRLLDEIAPDAERAGTIIALENTFFENPPPFSGLEGRTWPSYRFLNDDCALLRYYMLAYGNPWVRLCMDIGHSNLFGHRLEDDFEAMRGHVALFHIHDNDGKLDLHYRPGLGTLPYGFFASKLKEDQYDLPLFVEVLNDPDPALADHVREADGAIAAFRATRKVLEDA